MSRAQHGMWAVGAGLRHGKVEGRGSLLGILGDVDENGPGTAGPGHLKRLTKHRCEIFRARYKVVVLGDGQRDAGDVHFLKGIGAKNLRRNLAGDGDDGNAVQHGRCKPGDKVGCAGAAGGHADPDLATGAGVAVGHVGGTLLVPYKDMVDRGELAQGVVDGQDGAAGITEHGGDTFAGKGGPGNFRAGKGGGSVGGV